MAWIQRIKRPRLTWLPQTAGDTPVTVNAQPATLTLSGVSSGATLGGITVNAQTATLALSASSGSATPPTGTTLLSEALFPATASAFNSSNLTTVSGETLLVIAGFNEFNGVTDPSADLTISNTGTPLTFTPVLAEGTDQSFSRGIVVWTAPVTAGETIQLTFDCGARNVRRFMLFVRSYSGFDATDFIGETGEDSDTTNSGSTYSFNLTGTTAATSEVVASVLIDGWTSATEGASWTELADVGSSGNLGMETQARTAAVSTADWAATAGGATTLVGAAVEVKGLVSGVILGPLTVNAQPATLVLSGVEGTPPSPGQEVNAQPAALTLSGVEGTPTLTGITVTAQVATLSLSGLEGTPTLSPATVNAQPATLVLSGVENGVGVRYVGEIGFWESGTPESFPIVVPTTHDVPAGDLLVVMGAVNNYLSGGVADTASPITIFAGDDAAVPLEPAIIADPGAANEGVQGFIAYWIVTTTLSTASGIAVAFPTSTISTFSIHHFRNADPTTPVLASSYAVQNNQTGQSVSVGAGADPTMAGQVVLALVAVEGDNTDAFTQDTDTTRGTWETLARRSSGTGTSGVTANQSMKFVAAAGAQTYDHATMLGTARDHAAGVLVLNPASDVNQPVTVNAQPATLSLSAVTSGATLGALTVNNQPATLSLSGIQTAPSLGALTVNNQTGVVALSGVPGAATPAAVTVNAQVAALSLSALSGTTTLSALTVNNQPGILTLLGLQGQIEGQAVTVEAQPGILLLSAMSSGATLGPIAVNNQPATVVLSAVSGTATVGALTVTAQVGTVVLSGVPGSIAGGAVSVTAQIATLTLSAEPGTPTAAALTLLAQAATLALSGQPGAVDLVAATVAGQVGILVLSGVPGSIRGQVVTPGPFDQHFDFCFPEPLSTVMPEMAFSGVLA